jgi:putative tryptophan/tyrosine transport system substrate-binding protein
MDECSRVGAGHIQMKRREFLLALGGAAASVPLAARAQQKTMPVIGFLNSRSPAAAGYIVGSFRQGLKEAGYVEGQNVRIEFRYAEGQYERLPALAAELIRLQVAVIVAGGTADPAKHATAAIPIIFTSGLDPVAADLVSSVNRPDGNITGITFYSGALVAKQIELLREIAPKSAEIGFLANSKGASAKLQTTDALAAASAVGLKLRILSASTEADFEKSFAALAGLSGAAMVVGVDPFFDSRPDQLAVLAARYRVPTVYNLRGFVEAGGLMSYGASITDSYRQAGVYAGRILKGDKISELPVLYPTKFELIINLKTAKTLGLSVPPTLLATADEVIE